jgi:hypothetical protein
MILFRRVGSAFRGIEGREWALLTMETLGVIAGILIAFWLNEWGARRNAGARQHEMMERLLEESENDISVLRDFRDPLQGMVRKEQAFAVELGQGACPANKDFEAVSTLAIMPAMTVPTAVHEELMAAGGLSSIKRQDVREHVAAFYGTLEWAQRQVDYFRESRVIALEESDPRIRIRFDPAADEPQVDTYDGKALCSDQAFKNRIAAATRAHSVFTSYFAGSTQDAISMCVRIADSLGKTCSPNYGGPLKGKDAAWATKAAVNMRKELAQR